MCSPHHHHFLSLQSLPYPLTPSPIKIMRAMMHTLCLSHSLARSHCRSLSPHVRDEGHVIHHPIINHRHSSPPSRERRPVDLLAVRKVRKSADPIYKKHSKSPSTDPTKQRRSKIEKIRNPNREAKRDSIHLVHPRAA
uniref:Uncharacterized protein n=1 Tax=Lotharella globosa TaxID=91324 RepID=A0A7S3Z546_9EUKA|mmetsp:Transcript_2304/g.4419  ORF Transcript_2304/g.4419 Transcript_2304/m.4419 type:complete len:138 (-) Transcript_2304:201-614(-)